MVFSTLGFCQLIIRVCIQFPGENLPTAAVEANFFCAHIAFFPGFAILPLIKIISQQKLKLYNSNVKVAAIFDVAQHKTITQQSIT
jgi:hypothetical protein